MAKSKIRQLAEFDFYTKSESDTRDTSAISEVLYNDAAVVPYLPKKAWLVWFNSPGAGDGYHIVLSDDKPEVGVPLDEGNTQHIVDTFWYYNASGPDADYPNYDNALGWKSETGLMFTADVFDPLYTGSATSCSEDHELCGYNINVDWNEGHVFGTLSGLKLTNTGSTTAFARASDTYGPLEFVWEIAEGMTWAVNWDEINTNNTTTQSPDLSGYYTKAETDGKVVELSPPTDLSNYYTKAQTDSNIVTLSPPTDLSSYYNMGQVDSIINTLKGTASADFDTLGELEAGIDASELSVVTNAAAIVDAQDQIMIHHP